MKKIIFMFVLLAVTLTLSACSLQKKDNVSSQVTGSLENIVSQDKVSLDDGFYEVKSDFSSVAWRANKVLAAHTGLVAIKSGELIVSDGQLSSSEIILDMTTLTSDEGMDSLVTHLKSADFFEVENYPEARLTITSSTPGDQLNEYIVSGDLTIKGITKPISFRSIINASSKELTARAEIIINRLDWDIKYRSGKFFQDLGDNLISDEISFVVDLNASKTE